MPFQKCQAGLFSFGSCKSKTRLAREEEEEEEDEMVVEEEEEEVGNSLMRKTRPGLDSLKSRLFSN